MYDVRTNMNAVNRTLIGNNRRVWNVLIEQIIKGNVIPVIGGEMTYDIYYEVNRFCFMQADTLIYY